MASSSARKPIAHHGQTISETKSMRIGVVMALLGGRWCCDRGGVVEFRAAGQCGFAIPGYDAHGCASAASAWMHESGRPAASTRLRLQARRTVVEGKGGAERVELGC